MQKTIAKLFDVHQNTVSNWKKENKPGLNLIFKYFSKQELEEFLETGKIEKFDYIDSYLKNLKSKCLSIYRKIERIEIKYKNQAVDYADISMFSTPNYYLLYVLPFFKKHEEEIKLFDSNKFKINFFNLALTHHFEFRNNGIKESYVTFQILEILDELSNTELYYFFNKFNIMED